MPVRAVGGPGVADSGVSVDPKDADDLEAAAAVFTSLRPRLFGMDPLTPNERAAKRVAAFMNAITWFWDGLDVRWADTNGQTAAVLWRDGGVYGVLTVSASTDGIDQVLWILNPEKIAALPVRS